MSAADPGTPLGGLPRFLKEILDVVDALGGKPPSAATQAMLSNYAARVSSLAGAVWQRNPLPGDVKFGLEDIGTSLQILAGEVASGNKERMQDIKDCKELIIHCGQKTEERIHEIRRREAP